MKPYTALAHIHSLNGEMREITVLEQKDGTTLLMKKDLTDFMKYTLAEAQKVAEKGATGTCVEDKVVYGWLMHYFEEDDIEGNYFNLYGTPYTPLKKKPQSQKTLQLRLKQKKLSPKHSLLSLI